MLYREWTVAAVANSDVKVAHSEGRSLLQMSAAVPEVVEILSPGTTDVKKAAGQLYHAVTGLARLSLLDSDWRLGPSQESEVTVPWAVELRTTMSPSGMELFSWALGEPDFTMQQFRTLAGIASDSDLPRMRSLQFPKVHWTPPA
ncbi:hypothetical protein EDF54_1585 [Rathayibacter sp. PhB93]|nr:hypothetical protein EDF54_1585 [Rathayibacter sp. PhB93]TDQ14379.1 hypothetical protein EDF17_1404 [Rathayibacter sp. PhB1]